MKTFIIALFIGSSFLSLHGQVATTEKSDLLLTDTSKDSKSITPTILKSENSISLSQLSQMISDSLMHDDLLRKNNSECALLLEVLVDEEGVVNGSKILESNSSIMSKIVLNLMKSVDVLKIDQKRGKGISKVKIPVHYSL